VNAVRRRAALALFAAAAASYVLDRLTKVWAERTLPGDPLELIPGVLTLRFTTNTGGAFSLFSNIPWFFVAVSLVISTLIVVTAFRHTDLVVGASLGLVLGGAVGNLTDRLVRGTGALGEVVDFIDVHFWPVFNVADSAIVVGAGFLVFASWRRDRTGRSVRTEDRDA
jgi:signal peptidase II